MHASRFALVIIGVVLSHLGCGDGAEPPPRYVYHEIGTSGDLERDRVCLDSTGTYTVSVRAGNTESAATAILSRDDGSDEGEFVTMAMRVRNQPITVRSESVELLAGEPCYFLSVQTGVRGVRANARIESIDLFSE